ncbi:MAG: thiamine pyrophosphate-binding protein [Planctomycetes bacterium]|nr:thiamine pyrophosphate-binding protein [Planctomycetota bacterium]
MSAGGADLVVQALAAEGVRLVFGIPGTHTIELFDALRRRADEVRPVLVTDEQAAGFMADGAWRASGGLAALALVPGAGVTHALSGIAEAFLDQVPMLVLAAGVRRDSGRAYQLHDVDQVALARPVTKAQVRVEALDDLHAAVREACRLARRPPGGPVLVEVPAELLLTGRGRAGAPPPAPAPAPLDGGEMAAALAALGRARRPLLYLGAGAAGAGPDLVALAERLEAPVTTTISGKGVFPEDHPLWAWCGFGTMAPPFVREVTAGCDLLLAIGCRFGEVATASYGLTPPGPLVHVDVDPAVFGRNLAPAVTVTGDAAAFVSAAVARLPARPRDPALRAWLAQGHADTWADWLATRGEGVSPARLLRGLQAAFGPEAVFAADSGNGLFLAMEHLRLPRPRSFLAPVDYSCMGYAVPAAIGAALACPDRPVVALPGDGAFLMTGLELLTAAHQGAAVATFVLRDGALGQIAQFQERVLARTACTDLPDYDLAALAGALGVEALTLTFDDQVDDVARRARAVQAQGRPVVVDVAVDASRPTFFTRGVLEANWSRLPWRERLRLAARVAGRRLLAWT